MPDYNEGYEQDSYVEDQSSYDQEQVSEANPLEAKLAQLQEQIAALTQGIANQSKPAQQKQEPADLSDEQWAAIAKDPKLLGQYVKAQMSSTKKDMQMTQQKAQFDQKAEEKFPALKSNKDLQQKVATKMREMVDMGEYTWDSPTLLYRAAEIVAPTMGGVQEVERRRGLQSNSEALDASNTSVHNRTRGTQTKIADNDPRLMFARAYGIDKDPKKFEAFKATLKPYVAPERKNGRSLMK
jgi:hypothetical protein